MCDNTTFFLIKDCTEESDCMSNEQVKTSELTNELDMAYCTSLVCVHDHGAVHAVCCSRELKCVG